MTAFLTEEEVERIAMRWFSDIGYEIASGPDISPGGSNPERDDFRDVILERRLKRALERINPHVPEEAIEEAMRKLMHLDAPDLIRGNMNFHRMLREGVDVTYEIDGERRGDKVWLFDFKNPENNDFLAVNQFTVIYGENNRRPDIVLFVNGIPLAVIEVKGPDQKLKKAYNDHQTKMMEIPTLYHYNEVLAVLDESKGKIGTISAGWDRFSPWKYVEYEGDESMEGSKSLIYGLFNPSRFMDYVENFIIFERAKEGIIKKAAMYHQFYGVNKAVERTFEALRPEGDGRIGVFWHTQGSGKSLSMIFYTGKVRRDPRAGNPTFLVLTDRNDLDNQLFHYFDDSTSSDSNFPKLFPPPVQAEDIEDLKEKLRVSSEGIVFSTIQKFRPDEEEIDFPLLTDRNNVIVIVDEAHRSQYNFMDGFARHLRSALPNASFLAFTGTPIELKDRSTRAVFGDYVSIYDVNRSLEDHATVPIYYEARLVKLHLIKSDIDREFEEITEDVEDYARERMKTKWATLEKLAGNPERLKYIAEDIVRHFEEREKAMKGKGMIVCMSRDIASRLYDEIIRIRPEWHSEDDDKGEIKVVYTGSASDPPHIQRYVRNKRRRENIKQRFKDPKDPLKVVIVRDMWLTGFDNPSLHTMYIDKPMKGHNLMQAITRVNRVFKDKPGGLIVDYIGIAYELKSAVKQYTVDYKAQDVYFDYEQAINLMLEKYDIVSSYFHGIDYSNWRRMDPEEKMELLRKAQDRVVVDEDTKKEFVKQVIALSKAFALVSHTDEAREIRDDLSFFQTVKRSIMKHTPPSGMAKDVEKEAVINQLISEAVGVEGVVDIFGSMGEKKPMISVLDEGFLQEVLGIEEKNLRLEVLKKLLEDEIIVRMRKNPLVYHSLQELLENTLTKYHNRAITSAEAISTLVKIAEEIKKDEEKKDASGMSDEERAFYTALIRSYAASDSPEEIFKILSSDESLSEKDRKMAAEIASELVRTIKKNLTIDWTKRESSKSKVRAAVKRLLLKKGFGKDKRDEMLRYIMQQAEMLYENWSEA